MTDTTEALRAVDPGEDRLVQVKYVPRIGPEPVTHGQPDEVEAPFGDPGEVLFPPVADALVGEHLQQVEAAPAGEDVLIGFLLWGGGPVSGNIYACRRSSSQGGGQECLGG